MGELPEPWSTATERAGIRQAYRGIADAAGISHVTVRRLITGDRTSAATIRKVAAALGVEESMVYEWAGIPVSKWGPWDPPMQAHKLNPRARAALDELIRAITEEGGTSDERQPEAQKSPPPGNVRPLSPKHQQMLEDAQEAGWAAYDGSDE